MTFVGCDLHTRTQQVAVLDTCTGEVSERQLGHDGKGVEQLDAALPRPVTVGIESTGYSVWFHTLTPTSRARTACRRRRQDSRHGRSQDQDGYSRRPPHPRPAAPRSLSHDLGAGSRHTRSARAPHASYAPRAHPHHGQEWPACHCPELPTRPWLQAAPPSRPGTTARPRPPPAHHAAPRSQPAVARRAQRADP